MKKLLLAFFSFFFAASSFAQDDCSEFYYIDATYQNSYHKAATVQEVCDLYYADIKRGTRTQVDLVGVEYKESQKVYICKTHRVVYKDYPTGYIYKKECKNKCKAIAGKVTKLSVPAGWVHVDSTGEMRDFKPSGSAPDQVCKGGCQYLLMSNEVVPGSTVYAPKINNGGYHPVFSQFTYAGTDTQCQAETDLTTPSTPPPPEKPKEPEKPFTCPTGKCPGVVNGEQVCVPCDAGSGDGKDKEDKKDDNKADSKADPASSAASSAGNGNGNGSNGQGNGNGTGNGQGSGGGSGSGSGSKSDSTGKRPGESEGDDDGPPPQYGERPELYEPKYKDGVKGVWEEKKGQLKDTKLGQLAKKLMPKENKGDCPKWQIDMNWGKGMNFGLLNLAPPCAIWPVLRAIVMVCALLLARRLVFGG